MVGGATQFTISVHTTPLSIIDVLHYYLLSVPLRDPGCQSCVSVGPTAPAVRIMLWLRREAD